MRALCHRGGQPWWSTFGKTLATSAGERWSNKWAFVANTPLLQGWRDPIRIERPLPQAMLPMESIKNDKEVQRIAVVYVMDPIPLHSEQEPVRWDGAAE
jgi:hypothetical protein